MINLLYGVKYSNYKKAANILDINEIYDKIDLFVCDIFDKEQ